MVQPSPSLSDLALLDPDGSFRSRLEQDRERLSRDGADIASLRVVVHQLAGAAGTFGYAEVGDIAMALDDRIADGRRVTQDHLDDLLFALDRAIDGSA